MKPVRTVGIQLFLVLIAIMLLWPEPSVLAAPYEGYNYNSKGEPTPAPLPYLPEAEYSGEQLGVGGFTNPEDFYITDSGDIYIADTGNNRIVQLNKDFQLVKIISHFILLEKEEGFNRPAGITVGNNGNLFIADTGNARIVELDADGKFVRIIGAPQHNVIPEGFRYVPIKLAVDAAGRIYVVGQGSFEGILEFDTAGRFKGFLGVNKVVFNWVDLFWKRVMTKEQQAQMILFIPMEFNSVALDQDGFLLATSKSSTTESIKRLNPSGIDVLRRQGYFVPSGDVDTANTGTASGASTIVAATSDESGMYSILDSKRGRIFTYDRDGNLLYQFGLIGDQIGNFKVPIQISMMGERVVVLDYGSNQLIVFGPTRYGGAIRQAVIESDLGNREQSVAAWDEVLKLNSNLEIAWLSRGRAELQQGNNLAAMQHFKTGMHQQYYSRAFERFRKEFVWDNFNSIMLGLVIAGIGLFFIRRLAIRRLDEPGAIRIGWYAMFHPLKGFWDIKYERKGHLGAALAILAALSLFVLIRQQFSGFIFSPHSGSEPVNTLKEISLVIAPFLLWCVANWSLTTLMDGEGKFQEIVIATSYAMLPLVLVQLPLLALSRIMTLQEASFYYLFESVIYIWCGILLFVGMMVVHQYSVSKTIATMLLTCLVIAILIFLALLFFSLAQQMMAFVNIIFNEIRFRIGEEI